eukprot:7456339-Lingulodinium_polyedra.AAC.1
MQSLEHHPARCCAVAAALHQQQHPPPRTRQAMRKLKRTQDLNNILHSRHLLFAALVVEVLNMPRGFMHGCVV